MGLLPKRDEVGFTFFLFWVMMTCVGLEDPAAADSTAKCSVEDVVGREEDKAVGPCIMSDWPQSLALRPSCDETYLEKPALQPQLLPLQQQTPWFWPPIPHC